MTKVISIINHKGGVGKTTSAVNISAGLHKLNRRVLVIDLDPQSSLSISLGIVEPDKELNIYGALKGEYPITPIEILKGFDIVPSTLDLSEMEIKLVTTTAGEMRLQKLLNPLLSSYDYIVIDCPPSLGGLTVNALACSSRVYVPLQAQFLALRGLTKLLDIVDIVKESLNPSLEIGGVFTTIYDNRKILNRDIAETLEGNFSGKVFKTRIRETVSLGEAPTQGVDIFRYAPKSTGAEDYLALCREIIKQ
jgi:chromosome partitioning protein